MPSFLATAGEIVAVQSRLPWAEQLLAEGAGEPLSTRPPDEPTLAIEVEAERRPFATRGFELLARGAWQRGGEVVLENVCTSGFDLHVSSGAQPVFTYRWRPPRRERLTGVLLRSRFHLLARAALLQYPALWAAARRGRAPLHASGVTVAGHEIMLVAHSGVGRSTLLLEALADGAEATGDNLAVGDGETLWGLVEPLRSDGGEGRRMAHGRRESPFPNRIGAVSPSAVVVVERGASGLTPRDRAATIRALVTSTYAAGELRRFWPFAALLFAARGKGDADVPVRPVAERFADLPAYTLSLGPDRPGLSRLLVDLEVPV